MNGDGIPRPMDHRQVRVFPKVKAVAELLGFRSVADFCASCGVSRITLYRALNGNEAARRTVTKKLGPGVALAVFEGTP